MSAAHGPREHADSPRTRASPTTLPRSQAVRRLREFDLVLVLETAAECDAAVRLTLGWTETRLPRRNVADESKAHGHAHGHLGSRNATSQIVSQMSDAAVLRTQNKWDLALYRDAQAIASASCAALDRVANDQSGAVRNAIVAYRVARRAACDPHTHVAAAPTAAEVFGRAVGADRSVRGRSKNLMKLTVSAPGSGVVK